MITQQTVVMLTTVEDANEHPVLDADGNLQIDGASGRVVSQHRVDRLVIGQAYQLPAYQAQNLITLGFATAP